MQENVTSTCSRRKLRSGGAEIRDHRKSAQQIVGLYRCSGHCTQCYGIGTGTLLPLQ